MLPTLCGAIRLGLMYRLPAAATFGNRGEEARPIARNRTASIVPRLLRNVFSVDLAVEDLVAVVCEQRSESGYVDDSASVEVREWVVACLPDGRSV